MAYGYRTEAVPSRTPRCSQLDAEMPITNFEYAELYRAWRGLAQALERELLSTKSYLEIARAVAEGRHGLG